MSVETEAKEAERANSFKIVMFEDNPDFVKSYIMNLKYYGIEIAAVATNMDEAAALIEKLPQMLDVGAALVDGKMHPGCEGNADGEIIAGAIKGAAPHIVVIGFAGLGKILVADRNCDKTNSAQVRQALIEIRSSQSNQ